MYLRLKCCKENFSGGRHLVLYWNVEFSDFHNAIDTTKIYDKKYNCLDSFMQKASELIIMNMLILIKSLFNFEKEEKMWLTISGGNMCPFPSIPTPPPTPARRCLLSHLISQGLLLI